MPLTIYCTPRRPAPGCGAYPMLDAVFLVSGIVFLLLTAAYGEGCRRL